MRKLNFYWIIIENNKRTDLTDDHPLYRFLNELMFQLTTWGLGNGVKQREAAGLRVGRALGWDVAGMGADKPKGWCWAVWLATLSAAER